MTADLALLEPAPSSSPHAEDRPSLHVTVFSKNDCPDCAAVKQQFTRKGVPFEEINVQLDLQPRAEFGGLTPLEHVVQTYGQRMPAIAVTDHNNDQGSDWWTGRRIDKTVETITRFREAGLLIPEEQRIPL